MTVQTEKYGEDLETFQKRVELLVGAKLKVDNKVKKAVMTQDNIRAKTRGWDGTKEIRRWRENKAA